MNNLYFRAWNPTTKEMAKVDSINLRGDNNRKPYMSLDSNNVSVAYFDEVILMQGIEIDEGKVIYEGDLVKYSTPWYEDYPTYRVEFHEGSFYFDTDGYTCIPINSMYDLNELEVIGNIYENEEVVEK